LPGNAQNDPRLKTSQCFVNQLYWVAAPEVTCLAFSFAACAFPFAWKQSEGMRSNSELYNAQVKIQHDNNNEQCHSNFDVHISTHMKVMQHQDRGDVKMAGGGFQHVTKNKLCLKWERHDDANCHRAFALALPLALGLALAFAFLTCVR